MTYSLLEEFIEPKVEKIEDIIFFFFTKHR